MSLERVLYSRRQVGVKHPHRSSSLQEERTGLVPLTHHLDGLFEQGAPLQSEFLRYLS